MPNNQPSLNEVLDQMELEGSLVKAADKLGISQGSYRSKFNNLPDEDPLKKRYLKLCGKAKGGRPRSYNKKHVTRKRQPSKPTTQRSLYGNQ